MLHRRRYYLKWASIVIAYICIFGLSYQYGTSLSESMFVETTPGIPRHLLIKHLVYDHGEYLNSSTILQMLREDLAQPFEIENITNSNRSIRNGLVLFYDVTYHHIYFQRFLWLYTSWTQLPQQAKTQNDLIVFISSATIPDDFVKLVDYSKKIFYRNQLKIYPMQTLLDSILSGNLDYFEEFPLRLNLELMRLFYEQKSRLFSLLLFLSDECHEILRPYDFLFRMDIDSFLMSKFGFFRPSSSLVLGESVPHDRYTLNRLERLRKSFSSPTQSKTLLKRTMTICWFARLSTFRFLIRRTVLMALWLMKEEFTESERLHHLTYLNYPSWYMDAIFEYAASLILSLTLKKTMDSNLFSPFDCRHSIIHCLHISLRDPSHHLHVSKQALHLLASINQTNLTNHEVYIQKTVIKSNRLFRSQFL